MKQTLEQFLEASNIIHQNKYNYSLVVYRNTYTKVQIICPDHGPFFQVPGSHTRGAGCKMCSNIARKNTNFLRYGGHPKSTKEVQDKFKKTCQERYGSDSPLGSREIQAKSRSTSQSRYGGHPTQTHEVQHKKKQTNLKRYGVEHQLQRVEAQSKFKQTMIDRYGCHAAQQHMQDSLPMVTDYDWLVNQYVNLGKSAVQIADELKIGDLSVGRYLRKHNIPTRQTEMCSFKCVLWLESIMESEKISIQHSQNGGEFKIPGTRWKADGYCVETNTVYEFHGDYWHGNPKMFESDAYNNSLYKTMGELYQKTIDRENTIKELGYNLVVMWENNWDNRES